MRFNLNSEFEPAGDQPQAIEKLVAGIRAGEPQTLQGITGSGKTFTIANVIQQLQRPVLLLSHNKTLAAQLFSELKTFFPDNAVEFFISYYDYYLPESYLPQTDTYIAKDASINDEIEKHRLSATSSLLGRKDVIIVASVSCIYGLGAPDAYAEMTMKLKRGDIIDREKFIRQLVEIQYERNDMSLARGCFSVLGDTVEVYPAYKDECYRIEFWDDEVERLTRRDPLTKKIREEMDEMIVYPAKHFVLSSTQLDVAIPEIMAEMEEQVAKFEKNGKLVEAQRIYQRTNYDMEMLREMGYCQGIENYSMHLSPTRTPGSTPDTLIDFFGDEFITIIDESHVTVPQVRGMYNADRSRKQCLVDYGFRLPSALDNRPLNFEEFENKTRDMIYVSATPSMYELERTVPVVQEIRPTGLLDPHIEVRPLGDQIDNLIEEVRQAAESGERVLVTTLTKKTSENLADYLRDIGIRVKYLHSEIDSIERVEILRGLRAGEFDCLIGVNLLREGLDLPEVALVAILDADKTGFLRSESALFQTAGRAARNVNGRVIFYADKITPAMKTVLETTERRRARQMAYNEEHHIKPQTIKRAIQKTLKMYDDAENMVEAVVAEESGGYEVTEVVRQLELEMEEAALAMEFERAAMLRDQIFKLKGEEEKVFKYKKQSHRKKKKK